MTPQAIETASQCAALQMRERDALRKRVDELKAQIEVKEGQLAVAQRRLGDLQRELPDYLVDEEEAA